MLMEHPQDPVPAAIAELLALGQGGGEPEGGEGVEAMAAAQTVHGWSPHWLQRPLANLRKCIEHQIAVIDLPASVSKPCRQVTDRNLFPFGPRSEIAFHLLNGRFGALKLLSPTRVSCRDPLLLSHHLGRLRIQHHRGRARGTGAAAKRTPEIVPERLKDAAGQVEAHRYRSAKIQIACLESWGQAIAVLLNVFC